MTKVEEVHKRIDKVFDKIDDLQTMIVGDPPRQKGVFQRIDELTEQVKITNGRVSRNEGSIKKLWSSFKDHELNISKKEISELKQLYDQHKAKVWGIAMLILGIIATKIFG